MSNHRYSDVAPLDAPPLFRDLMSNKTIDQDALALASELRDCKLSYAFGIPVCVFAQAYALACGVDLDIPDKAWNKTAIPWSKDLWGLKDESPKEQATFS